MSKGNDFVLVLYQLFWCNTQIHKALRGHDNAPPLPHTIPMHCIQWAHDLHMYAARHERCPSAEKILKCSITTSHYIPIVQAPGIWQLRIPSVYNVSGMRRKGRDSNPAVYQFRRSVHLILSLWAAILSADPKLRQMRKIATGRASCCVKARPADLANDTYPLGRSRLRCFVLVFSTAFDQVTSTGRTDANVFCLFVF